MRSFVIWQGLVINTLLDAGLSNEDAFTAVALDLAAGHAAFMAGGSAYDYAARLARNTPPEAPEGTVEASE